MKMMAMMVMMIAMTPRGWRPVLTKSLRVRHRLASTSHRRELLRGRRANPAMVNGGGLHRAALTPTPLP